MEKLYTRIGLSVLWQPDACIHCGNCVSGLPSVFNVSKRPWIDVNAASIDAIKEQVAKCPSGAISVKV